MRSLLKKWGAAVCTAALILSTLLSTPATAHRVKSCLTTVDWKADGSVQITHRVHYHDAVEVLRDLQRKAGGIKGKETLFEDAGIARMALYVSEDFTVKSGEKSLQNIDLTVIGGEVEGDYFYLYFESKAPVSGDELAFKSDIFRADFPSQVNTVIVTKGKTEKSIILMKKNQVKSINF